MQVDKLGLPDISSSEPILNMSCPIIGLAIVKNYIRTRYAQKNNGWDAPDEVVNVEFKIFTNTLLNSSKPYNDHLRPFIKPELQFLRVFQVFEIFMEDYLRRLLIHCPENTEIHQRWKAYKSNLVDYRYSLNLEDYQKILDFLNFIQEQLRLYGEETAHDEQAFWDNWRGLFKSGDVIDFNCLNLQAFFENPEKLNYYISVDIQHFLHAYTLLAQKLNQDLNWVVDEIERAMQPFAQLPQVYLLNNSCEVLEFIRKIKNEFLPLTQRLILDDVTAISYSSKQEFDRLFTLFDHIKDHPEDHPLADTTFLKISLEKLLRDIQSRGLLQEGEADIQVLLDDREYMGLSNVFKQPKVPVSTIQNGIKFVEVHSHCHKIWDTYVTIGVSTLNEIRSFIIAWAQRVNQRKQLANALSKLALERFGPSPARKELSKEELDQLARSFEEPSSSKKPPGKQTSGSKPSPKGNQSRVVLAKAGKKVSPPAVKAVKRVNPPLTLKLQTQERAWDLVSSTLVRICIAFQAEELRFKQIAVRQALMNHQDLIVLQRRFAAQQPTEYPMSLASAVWQASYRHLEQLFRYTVLLQNFAQDPKEKLDQHHLLLYEGQMVLPKEIKKDVLRRICLANLWDALTYEQWALRSQLLRGRRVLPEVLQEARQMAENPASEESGKVVRELPKLIDEVFKFTMAIPIDTRCGIAAEPRPMQQTEMVFNGGWKATVEGFRQIERAAREFIKKHDPESLHPAVLKLRQLLKDLQVLEGNIQRLREPLSSLEFAMIVRNVCHWEHAIGQQMLRALVYLKTGVDIKEHDLAFIYAQMSWRKDSNPAEVKFLEAYFQDIHRLSFYPFDNRQVACHLHHAVLAAELLREHPISEIGFKIGDDKAKGGKTTTALNFIPVDTSLLTVDAIIQVLETSHNGLMRLMEQRFIPELTHLT